MAINHAIDAQRIAKRHLEQPMRERQRHQRRRSDPVLEVCVHCAYHVLPHTRSFIEVYQVTFSFTAHRSLPEEVHRAWVTDPSIRANLVRETKAARCFL